MLIENSKLRTENSCDAEPRPIEVSAPTFRASAGRMERGAREVEAAIGADRGAHPEAFAVRPDGALDVAEIVLEGADGDSEFVAEVVKHPLLVTEALDDLLPPGEPHVAPSDPPRSMKPVRIA